MAKKKKAVKKKAVKKKAVKKKVVKKKVVKKKVVKKKVVKKKVVKKKVVKKKVKKPGKDRYPQSSKVILLEDWMDKFILHNYLRQLNHARTISKEQKKHFKSLTEDFNDVYKFLVGHFRKRMLKGDTKPISIILKALGLNALKLPWFVDSLSHLLGQGKRAFLHIPKNKKRTALLNKMRRFEKKLRAGKTLIDANSFFDGPVQTVKTDYGRDLDDEIQIFILRYTFLFLYPKEFTHSREILF